MKSIRQWTLLLLFAVSQSLLSPSVSALEGAQGAAQEIQFSDAELAQMLAPIALYPDSLLTHILIASTYPLEVVQAKRWRDKHQNLDSAEAVKRAEKQYWDPSVTALVAFPDVLQRLSDDLEWTQKLGDAFLQDEGRVLDSIQGLRQQAEEADAFDEMKNMRVTKVNRQIIIEPVQPEVIYVPYYDTRVVYGHWHWYNYPPVYWAYPPSYGYYRPGHFSSHFYWNSGIRISFNFFFSAFSWRHRHIVVTHHHHTAHYRPHKRIVTSHGAQRWNHKPAHRHGVAYRSPKVKARYGQYRPNRYDVKQHKNVGRHDKMNPAKHQGSAQIQARREQNFSHKLSDSRQHKVTRADKHQQPTKYYEKRDKLNLKGEPKADRASGNKARDWSHQSQGQRDKSLQRDMSPQRDKSLQRNNGYQRDKSPQRNNSYQRDKSPQRDKSLQPNNGYQRDKSPQRDNGYQRDKSLQPNNGYQPNNFQRERSPQPKSYQRNNSHQSTQARGAASHSQQGRIKQRDH
ncbi:DUF3300 domain-containing protein [Shewanella marisflavi]|uniref:DUF3300 domain-containing protein n=1 Tax=Shewanella marisflavi TaxID=260364 RepID=A0AAC9TYP1_9GAMM|nr:DUF3300 domain-containing protein [Shewanella marisflavi]ASJ96153.1 hypothetical protein CFF01_05900 [Shewanella marisflavi]